VPRPLYLSLSRATLQLGTGNAGLWYDKLCDRWSDDWTLSGDDEKKLAWIETVTQQRVGLEPLLAEATARMLRLAVARSGAFGIFITESRFVTGLGRSHPVENGFAWHPTLGVPYLPGSSVKGLVRAWAERDSEPRPSRERVDEILGSAGVAGRVGFTDAVPVAPVQLEADVMTPHYAGWSPEEPPGDWCGPVPVPFLVTAPQTAFAFSLLPTHATGTGTVKDVFEWLRAALTHAGAGAKTSVGYGRFRYDEPKTQAWTKELDKERRAQTEAARRTEAQRTPEGRWSVEIEGKTEREILDLVRVHLEREPLPDPAERQGLARAVAATGLTDLWRKGQKREPATQVGSKKLKERAHIVDVAAGADKGSPQ
jgi:CRISPR-associated protein Cmr6